MNLSKTEEQLMKHLWKLEKAFMKDLIDCYDDPKPATTTIATLLKRMQDKGYIGFEMEGRARRYFPKMERQEYVSGKLHGFVSNFFGDSTSQFASFFTKSTNLTKEELKELRDIIDNQIEEK